MATKLHVARPQEPVEPDSVVRWAKFDGYTYASLKTPNGWYTTQDPTRYGNQRVFPSDWDSLLDYIGEKNWRTLELLS